MVNKKCLSTEQIYDFVCDMATSQGFYGRLKREMEQNWEAWHEHIDNRFETTLDFVLFIEQ